MRGEHLAPDAISPDEPLVSVEPLVVHRSTLRTWVISLLAIPAVVVGVDVLWRQRIVGWVSERVFDSDPQVLEPRDDIWAWALVIAGGSIVAWGLKELFVPAPVLRTDDEGLHLRMLGPLRPAVLLPWQSLFDVDAGTLEDDGDEIEVLIVEVKEPGLLPVNPWAGRRVGARGVALFATEWDTPAGAVAEAVSEQALAVARSGSPMA